MTKQQAREVRRWWRGRCVRCARNAQTGGYAAPQESLFVAGRCLRCARLQRRAVKIGLM